MTFTHTFGQTLKHLRKRSKLTIYQLGALAGIPFTLISALENSRRTVGENNATKLGKALGLKEFELKDFVYVALDEAKGKLLKAHRGYSAELLNLLPTILKDTDIQPKDIKSTIIRPDYGDGVVADAVMFLTGRYRAYVHLEIREE